MDQLPKQVEEGFNLDNCVGTQLDILGKYQNVVRTVNTPAGFITLSDSNFRALIKLAIARNNSNGSLHAIDQLIFNFFGTNVLVFDYKNMRISYLVNSAIANAGLFTVLTAQGLLPRPMAVQMAAIVYAPVIDTFYGFVTYELPTAFRNSPMNTYAAYQMNRPWLSYSSATLVNLNLTAENGDEITQENGDELYI